MLIIDLEWKTDVMPVHAHWYYHVDCYYKGQLPGTECEDPKTLNSSDLLGHASCPVCHEDCNDREVTQ